MINAVFNHLWQSTICAAAAALLAMALRQNRAGVRYGLWLAGSVKFLVPFAWLMLLGTQLDWLWPAAAPTPTGAAPAPAMSVAIDQLARPFSDGVAASLPLPPSESSWLPLLLGGIWLCGFAAVAAMRVRGWRRVRAAVRASSPLETMELERGWFVPVRSSPMLLEPGVVGWRRPVLLLPAGIERYLTATQLDAVVKHELCHVRRRDNLTAAIHMLVEAVFWFHPLVWWIGARLVDERERACDEYVLRVCGEPQAYAEGILTVCKRYVESPVACVPGVTGSDLKRRIAHIMTNRIGLRLNVTRRLALGAAALAAFAVPVLAGAITAPHRIQAPTGQAAAAFDVASVKPCPVDQTFRGEHIDVSSHRAYYECFTVESLLNVAYAQDGNFTLNAAPERNVRGGPDWIRSERYTVEATTAATVQSFGPMLRTLFDDRFHVRSHKALEETPMYGLTVAKSGLKIKPIAEGDCVEEDRDAPAPAPKAGGKPPCGMTSGRKRGTVRTWELGGATFGDLAAVLDTDRKILDQTGVTKRFNIHLEYDLDEMTTTGVTVFRALEEQLGLRLVPTKGPHEVVVIDSIERPISDTPGAWSSGPPRARAAGR
jgi:uncharacterized protein (TIGR03435 family)